VSEAELKQRIRTLEIRLNLLEELDRRTSNVIAWTRENLNSLRELLLLQQEEVVK
jgi:hypothetical protein